MIAGLWVKLVATMGRDELAGFGARRRLTATPTIAVTSEMRRVPAIAAMGCVVRRAVRWPYDHT